MLVLGHRCGWAQGLRVRTFWHVFQRGLQPTVLVPILQAMGTLISACCRTCVLLKNGALRSRLTSSTLAGTVLLHRRRFFFHVTGKFSASTRYGSSCSKRRYHLQNSANALRRYPSRLPLNSTSTTEYRNNHTDLYAATGIPASGRTYC